MKIIINNQEIQLKKANNFYLRLKGFMLKKNIKEALVFKTKSIHTFFMKEPIDIIITNKDNKILKIYRNLEKNKIIFYRKAYYFYELPSNSISNLNINDILVIKNKED